MYFESFFAEIGVADIVPAPDLIAVFELQSQIVSPVMVEEHHPAVEKPSFVHDPDNFVDLRNLFQRDIRIDHIAVFCFELIEQYVEFLFEISPVPVDPDLGDIGRRVESIA